MRGRVVFKFQDRMIIEYHCDEKPMANILHINHRYWPVVGGSEQYVQAIAERQAAADHMVTVLATNADDFSSFWDPKAERLEPGKEQHNGVNIVRTPLKYLPGKPRSFGILRYIQYQLKWASSMSSRLSHLAPFLPDLEVDLAALGTDWDVVVAWNITFDGLTASAAKLATDIGAKFIAVPLLHLGEGPDSPVRRYYTMPHQIAYLKLADQVLVQSSGAKDFLVEQGVNEQVIAVVGAGIDPIKVSGGDSQAFSQRHHLRTAIVTAIGPLTYDKGTMHLVEAAHLLWTKGLSFTLVLAGPVMADFKAYWNKVPQIIRDQTLVLGFIQEREKKDLLAGAQLLALPSRTDSFGIVLLEAWFYGKPVIGALSGGIPAVIEDGVDGRLVPFGDPQTLSEAISEILLDPQKAQEWGLAGRQKTLSNYTWDDVYRRFSSAIKIG